MGEKYDEKCDIWAIGILSYEVMVGKLPFKINTERDLQKIVINFINSVQRRYLLPRICGTIRECQKLCLEYIEKEPRGQV